MAAGITIDGPTLRALRHDRLWSQAELASRSCAFARAEGDRQCGITRETISKLERGHRAPSPRTLRYLVGALRPAPADLRRLLRREPPRALSELASSGWTEEATARRELLASGLAAAAAFPLDTLRGIAESLDRPVGLDDLLLLLARSGGPGACSISLAPAVLAGAAARHVRTIEQLHGHATTRGRRQRLHAVGADAVLLAGWLAGVLDQRVEAQDAMTLAWRLARDTHDRMLPGRAQSLLSWLASRARSGGASGHPAGDERSACWRAMAGARHGVQRSRDRRRLS
ncbi:MAG: helix-turn-helix domain-containing protein [Egibacteraceae bacterium]